MKVSVIKLPLVGLIVSVVALVFSSTASAHVVVRPAEVLTAGFQTFTVGVPNEKDVPTTSVKLLVPEGLKHVSPTQKVGWQIDIEKEGEGEDAVVKSITWSGNTVAVGFRDEFTFSAQVPENDTELQWKAYQTYQNGEIVAWDLTDDQQPKKADGSPDFSKSGPFSVTKVVAETEQQQATKNADQAAADAKTVANRSLYIAIAGVIVGLAGVYFGTRKK